MAEQDNMPNIPFQLHDQAHSEWCWLAVAEAVVRYLDGRFINIRRNPSQCELASKFVRGEHRQRLECCGRGVPRDCNQSGRIENVLNGLGIPAKRRSGKLTFEQIQKTIGAGLPVIVRIGWGDTAKERAQQGHIVVIDGWHLTRSGKKQVEVRDPLFRDQFLHYRRLAYDYRGAGRWTHTIHIHLKPGGQHGAA